MSILALGCHRAIDTPGNTAARVRERSLTIAELAEWERSLPNPPSPEDRNSFTRHWIEDELLYQAALDKKLPNDPWVAARIRELTRSLIIAKYLDSECAGLADPSLEEVKAYYLKHSSEFVWPHLRLVVDYWRGENNNALERLRAALYRDRSVRGMDNLEGVESGRISLNGPGSADPQIWQLVSRLKVGQISEVTKIQKDCWIYKLDSRNEPGSSQDLADVQEEIAARLQEQSYSRRRSETLRKLTEEFKRKNELFWTPSSQSSDAPETQP
ncbi:MAG: peptidylprolyl isomerase [Calditrichota bacterium]